MFLVLSFSLSVCLSVCVSICWSWCSWPLASSSSYWGHKISLDNVYGMFYFYSFRLHALGDSLALVFHYMQKSTMKHWLLTSLSGWLSFAFSFHPSVCLSVCLITCLHNYLNNYMWSFSWYSHNNNCTSIIQCLPVSVCPHICACVSIRLTLTPYVCLCYFSVSMPTCMSVWLAQNIKLYVCLRCFSVYFPARASVRLTGRLSACMSACMAVCLPLMFHVWVLSLSICFTSRSHKALCTLTHHKVEIVFSSDISRWLLVFWPGVFGLSAPCVCGGGWRYPVSTALVLNKVKLALYRTVSMLLHNHMSNHTAMPVPITLPPYSCTAMPMTKGPFYSL